MRKTPDIHDLAHGDKIKVLRAMSLLASRVRVAIICTAAGSWFVYDLSKKLSRARVDALVAGDESVLVGMYAMRRGLKPEVLQGMVMDDLCAVGAI